MTNSRKPLITKKLLSPLLYLFVTIIAFAAGTNLYFSLYTYPYQTSYNSESGVTTMQPIPESEMPAVDLSIPIGLFLAPVIILLLGNILLNIFDKTQQPRISDHFRQTSLLYFFIVLYICMILVTLWGSGPGMPGGPFLVVLITSLAILVNAVYLISKRLLLKLKN